MADSRSPKRIKITHSDEENSNKCITDCMPMDILVDIASKVATQSLITDLYHLKLASKEFMNITDDDYVYKYASLDKVSSLVCLQHFPQEASFLNRCRSSGNLEILNREGILTYFWDNKLYEKGFHMIHKAAQKGHQRSMYAFAMIVLLMPRNTIMGVLGREELLEEALRYLRFLRNQKCVLKCREEVAKVVGFLSWDMHPRVMQVPLNRLCQNKPCKNTWRLKIGSWLFLNEDDDEKDPSMCENCRWDHELKEFSTSIFGTSVFVMLHD